MTKYRLHSVVSGQGPPIVLLHGFLSSSHYFKTMQPLLARTNTVISLDLLGSGISPKPHVNHNYDTQVSAIHDTLKTLNIDAPFVLLGHSMGALIALRYALRHPRDVKALELFTPPMFHDSIEAHDTYRKHSIQYGIMLDSSLRGLLWPLLKLTPRDTSENRPEINFADTVRTSPPAREGGYRDIIVAAEFFSDINQVSCPTLLVVGRHDRIEYQKNLGSAHLPKHIVFELIDTGHHPIITAPELSEILIRRYL
jgi:pimeloyl-ACP methyl ester carboxylesterase